MLETTGIALATLFTTIGPFDVAAVFAALTSSEEIDEAIFIGFWG